MYCSVYPYLQGWLVIFKVVVCDQYKAFIIDYIVS